MVDNRNIGALRRTTVAVARAAVLTWSSVAAAPIYASGHQKPGNDDDMDDPNNPSMWILLAISFVLVLTGGAFAGLTIALMGQDSIYLQVLSEDHTEPQQKNAKRVFDLLNKGKHWVLVTLLLSNVVVNESLPVVLDRCLGGGVAAVVGSTVLIVIFGEILPQSVCVRYGLQIGGFMSKPVLLLMYLIAPVAWPTAKLLDWVLGEDHGTVYKKSGLKTLVTLHKTLGDVSERLNQDEVTIISAVLDLKAKPLNAVMTPMDDVFTLPEDTILDEQKMNEILTAGYSRIPIYQTRNPSNFIGMLLVRILITYDPEDCSRVSDFALATLPETRPETSCLDILNFFQEGKSHMVLVSESPGEDHGAVGVVTLEDVIEELIGEEIIDESDVFVDIHKAIRRLTPAPKARPYRRPGPDGPTNSSNATPQPADGCHHRMDSTQSEAAGSGGQRTTVIMRRSSAGADGQLVQTALPTRKNFEEIREHLKHLRPNNRAANPRSTKYSAVKIKQHVGSPSIHTPFSGMQRAATVTAIPRASTNKPNELGISESSSLLDRPISDEFDITETSSLLERPQSAKSGVQAVIQSYGSVASQNQASEAQIRLAGLSPTIVIGAPIEEEPLVSGNGTKDVELLPEPVDVAETKVQQSRIGAETSSGVDGGVESKGNLRQAGNSDKHSQNGQRDTSQTLLKQSVRSGSITENVVEAGGVRKVVLDVKPVQEENEEIVRLEEETAAAAAVAVVAKAKEDGTTSPISKQSSRTSSTSVFLTAIVGQGRRASDNETSDESSKEDAQGTAAAPSARGAHEQSGADNGSCKSNSDADADGDAKGVQPPARSTTPGASQDKANGSTRRKHRGGRRKKKSSSKSPSH